MGYQLTIMGNRKESDMTLDEAGKLGKGLGGEDHVNLSRTRT